MLSWTARLGPSTWELELSPLLVCAPLSGLLAMGLAMAWLVRRKSIGALLLLPCPLSLALVPLLSPVTSGGTSMTSLFPTAATVITGAAVVSATALLTSLGAAGAALLAHRRRLLLLAVGVACSAGLGAWATARVEQSFRKHWNVPVLVTDPVEAHVGRAVRLTPRWAQANSRQCRTLGVFDCVWRDGPSEPRELHGCVAAQSALSFDEAGPREAELRGRCEAPGLSLSVTRRVDALGLEERGDARFPLRVGNRWRYQLIRHQRPGLLGWGLPISGARRALTQSQTLEIAGTSQTDAFRTFELVVTGHRVERFPVIAADGALWLLESGRRRPLLEQRPDGLFFAPLRATVEWSPAAPGRLPGPGRWVHGTDSVGSVVAAALTLGLVVPGSSRLEWELAETTEGTGPGLP